MPKPAQSLSWQEMRRLLASKSKTELLNLIRDLYILNTDNKDFIHAQVLTPKPTTPKTRQPKKPPSNTAKVIPKIRQLASIATELHEGASFNITRFTTLKILCEDATAAAHFDVHLAQVTYKKMQEQSRPSHLNAQKWAHYTQVVETALQAMQRYVEQPPTQTTNLLWGLQSQVRALQDRYENQEWGPIRIIESTEVLLIEYALSCLLQPTASADWGYRLARQYAERYDAHYGTGLIPESASMVEDIADFWCQYHLGKPVTGMAAYFVMTVSPYAQRSTGYSTGYCLTSTPLWSSVRHWMASPSRASRPHPSSYTRPRDRRDRYTGVIPSHPQDVPCPVSCPYPC